MQQHIRSEGTAMDFVENPTCWGDTLNSPFALLVTGAIMHFQNSSATNTITEKRGGFKGFRVCCSVVISTTNSRVDLTLTHVTRPPKCAEEKVPFL